MKTTYKNILLLVVPAILAVQCNGTEIDKPKATYENFEILTQVSTDKTPVNPIQTALKETITEAKETLYCAFSSLNDFHIAAALIEKKHSGIDLQIVADSDSQCEDAGLMALQNPALLHAEKAGALEQFKHECTTTEQQNGSTVPDDKGLVTGHSRTPNKEANLIFTDNGRGDIGYNFCIADYRHIWAGNYTSSPATTLQDSRNYPAAGFKIEFAKDELAREFTKEFTFLREGVAGAKKPQTNPVTRFSSLDQVIEIYWGPVEKPVDVILKKIKSAQKSIEIFSTEMSYTKNEPDHPEQFFNILNSKANQKVAVKVLTTRDSLFNEDSVIPLLNRNIALHSVDSAASFQLVIIDRGTAQQQILFFFGGIQTAANSRDDSLLWVMHSDLAVSIASVFFNELEKNSTAVNTIATDIQPGEKTGLVINEIMWMGSMSDNTETDPYDEFVELYNSSEKSINLSGYIFACSTGSRINSVVKLPVGTEIAADDFFTIARKNTGAFATADYFSEGLRITNSSTSCILTDGDESYIEAFTSLDEDVTGTIVDTAGDGTTAFNDNETSQISSTGIKDKAAGLYCSMERKTPDLTGSNISSWQSHRLCALPPDDKHLAQNILVTAGYRMHTMASPGAASSLLDSTPDPGTEEPAVDKAKLVISELNPKIAAGCDLIELTVAENGNMQGIQVFEGSQTDTDVLVTFTDFEVETGDIIMVHLDGNDTDNCNINAAANETTSKAQFATATYNNNYDTAYDWYSTDSGLTGTDNVIIVATGSQIIDLVVYTNNDGGATGAFRADACFVYKGTQWPALTDCQIIPDADLQNNATGDSDNLSSGVTERSKSFQRLYNSTTNSYCDTNSKADWVLVDHALPYSSLGVLNNTPSTTVSNCPQ